VYVNVCECVNVRPHLVERSMETRGVTNMDLQRTDIRC